MIFFKKSDKKAKNDPSKTILEIAEECDVHIRFDCRKGLCGTCKSQTISGTVEMIRPFALYPEEKKDGKILPCVAYCKEGDLIVDR